ncbi:hypothetical protein DFJ58DRAFT_844308 [Suillus subalutaceus]|uniref:uncharacterized protein n=1 Tax=Suillus subalutaceus TaxID=48586 RepID=UPI001B87E11F|nr:uncharacterized protein DFJ58DRAFT_844308 [Suillus subalutaceus]KAG1843458.1 hypothetical protein DFJ58DRAFT_844308 [Suillus subalutaceus]
MKRNYFRIDICIGCGRENWCWMDLWSLRTKVETDGVRWSKGVLDRNTVQWEVKVKPGSLTDLWDFSDIDDIDDFGNFNDFNDFNDFRDFDDFGNFDDFSEFNDFSNFKY